MKRRVCRAIPLRIHTHKKRQAYSCFTCQLRHRYRHRHGHGHGQRQKQGHDRPTQPPREKEREREERETRDSKGGGDTGQQGRRPTTCDKAFCQVSVQRMSNLASGYMPRCISMKLSFKELLLGRESLNAPFDLTTSPQPLTVDTGSCAVRNDARFACVYVYVYLCVCVCIHIHTYTQNTQINVKHRRATHKQPHNKHLVWLAAHRQRLV